MSDSPAQTYQDYFGPHMFEPWARELLDVADVQTGERVLDLACGTGIVTRQAAGRTGPDGSVVGLDISPGMLEVARSIPAPDGAPIEWKEGDAQDMSLPDNAFDVVVCQQGFQFVPDRSAAAREIGRVLDDGGRAAVAVWQSLDRHDLFRALFEGEADALGLPVEQLAVPFSLTDPDELQSIFSDAGFRDVEVVQRSLDVRFPSPDRFVKTVLLAGSAVIPQLGEMDPDELVAAVAPHAGPVVQRHTDGDSVKFPLHTNIALVRT